MISRELVSTIHEKYESLKVVLNERTARLWAATEANAIGRGGIRTVHLATGIAESTIRLGQGELFSGIDPAEEAVKSTPIRREGGGRKKMQVTDSTLLEALEALVEPTSRGDPISPLRWTCKSTRQLADELREEGHSVGHSTVAVLLAELGYGLQANRKTLEGANHPDRDAQFRYINEQTLAFQRRGQPVISVDTKKKELVGNFANSGREWRPAGEPEAVQLHDFADPQLGKVIPYGVYDVERNEGWVSVGIDHDTAEFAVASIHRWWTQLGAERYPDAEDLLIIADSGGSNSASSRLWKRELQRLSDGTGLTIHASHFPPGTSKWNKIEHRMFCAISANWRARPLVSHQVITSLIANTTTRKGLKIQAELDTRSYPTGIKVSDEELQEVHLSREEFHGEWNYRISPDASWR